MNISNVNTKHRIVLQGKYNAGIYVCRECHNDMLNNILCLCLGFAELSGVTVIIHECDKCFTKFYYHADETSYQQFLDWIGFGWNKFYTKKGNRRKIE